jgi:putative addiction module killer protein
MWRTRVCGEVRGNTARAGQQWPSLPGNVQGVGAGVYEYRIDFGPGYRIYFGKDGDRLVILLAGGTKNRQDADFAVAKGHWCDYRRRKRQEVT